MARIHLTTGLLATLSLISGGWAAPASLNIVGRDVALFANYDYIIVGGGTSGLTVADRLTEDADKTVLVIESGNLDDQEDSVLVPGLAGGTGKKYMYNMTCEPQPGINNRTYSFLAAHVVGGGTVVNGQAFDRGSRGDYDLWEALGNQGWGWEGLLPYFKKSETFTPSPPEIVKEWGIEYDRSAHGFKGPVMSSMPTYYYPAMKFVFKAWKQLGIPYSRDGTNGNALGAFYFSNSVDPVTRTRSYARTAHYEPVKGRPNLHLLTGQTVTKLVIEGKKASAVKFASSPTASTTTISAKKEIILAAGSGHTPQILQLSGIGPKTLLKSLGIPVVVDLPGVGANFQDHPSYYTAGLFTNDMNPSPANMSNATYAAEMLALYKYNRTGPYSSGFGTAAAFLTLPEIANKTRVSSLLNLIQRQDPSAHFPANTDATVIAGYKFQRTLLTSFMASGRIAVSENAFSALPGMLNSLQKPFSRGSIAINSTDPFANPVVDYRIFSNPADVEIFVDMIKSFRRVVGMPALKDLGPIITNPDPATVKSDEEIRAAIRANVVPTLAHPSCTCAMMKREHGGVVDAQLKVYGVKGLSIVDASVIPLIPATHLSSTVYAVAEKAADIIKARA
ncbi:uncharacterized protein LAJ45_07153 [Morchella importuna]|uniref:uncharacterized protein n=1 Tax=Morchella importuna TaxID=1174673 RepID=UPI001E8E387F|nr:uncharacterized protein LAJ45_07153 [Morchella importuna]KAH8148810.1 hypothetical protein LAJ45_07153 [Morchella importuna]